MGGVATTTTNDGGSYSIELKGQAPCVIRVTDPVTGVVLHSSVLAGATRANITPLTELVVANLFNSLPALAYSDFTPAKASKITEDGFRRSSFLVRSSMAALDADPGSMFDVNGLFVPATPSRAGDATDKKIDTLMAALTAANKKLVDLTTEIAKIGSTAADEAAFAITTKTLVGKAATGLINCPAARSGDYWLVDDVGTLYKYGFDFKNKTGSGVLLEPALSPTFPGPGVISSTQGTDGKTSPCGFKFTPNAAGREGVSAVVSQAGVLGWDNGRDGMGVGIPVQKLGLADLVGDWVVVGTDEISKIPFLRNTKLTIFTISLDGKLVTTKCNPAGTLIASCTQTTLLYELADSGDGTFAIKSAGNTIQKLVASRSSNGDMTLITTVVGNLTGTSSNTIVIGTRNVNKFTIPEAGAILKVSNWRYKVSSTASAVLSFGEFSYTTKQRESGLNYAGFYRTNTGGPEAQEFLAQVGLVGVGDVNFLGGERFSSIGGPLSARLWYAAGGQGWSFLVSNDRSQAGFIGMQITEP